MTDPKGFHLYVNLGASRTRRRLKGFGHGVRKVRSAGRHRAVVIHTATGRHLEKLQARFADVGCAVTPWLDTPERPFDSEPEPDPPGSL